MTVTRHHAGGRRLAGLAGLLAVVSVGWSSPAEPRPPFIPAQAGWLTTVNYYRSMAGLPPVVEDPVLSAAAALHSNYMLLNEITHHEDPARPGYTVEGDAAGMSSDVAVSSAVTTSDRGFVELWMTGPFHAIGVLRPNLTTVGYGRAERADTPRWRAGATLDVLHGLAQRTTPTRPILFPGDGTTTSLDRFLVETPDPLAYCGWTGSAGLPTLALLPERPDRPVASIVGPAGALDTCVLTADTTDGDAAAILRGDNAVVVIPRRPLEPGRYTETVTTTARTVTWSFTVDPAAALGLPAPTAVPVAAPGGFAPITPARLVDTRVGFGATRLVAGGTERIQITGTGIVPAGATAVDANVTVTGSLLPGYVTAWNGGGERPVVATVNFGAGEIVPNHAVVPLDRTGGISVFAQTGVDLVVDVTGYYGAGATGRFHAVTQARLMDSRIGLAATGPLPAGGTVHLRVAGVDGIPPTATAVALTLTSDDVLVPGYVTAFPGDRPRPFTANLNPDVGDIRSNTVLSAVAADGTVCLFTSNPVDLIVDVTGYVAPDIGGSFTPTVPFRFTDTRDPDRPELNAGLSGHDLQSGQTLRIQIAGRRGVPATATAVSVNIGVADASAAGFLTVWPSGDRPTTAAVNYGPDAPASNGIVLPLSPTGELSFYTMSTADLIVDVTGWWS